MKIRILSLMAPALLLFSCSKMSNELPVSAQEKARSKTPPARDYVRVYTGKGAFNDYFGLGYSCWCEGACYQVTVVGTRTNHKTSGDPSGEFDISVVDGEPMQLEVFDGTGTNKHAITHLHQSVQTENCRTFSFE